MTIRGFRQGRMSHLAAVVTAMLLGAGTPAAWAAPATSARPATALEVQSEPAGAAVYVDGQLKGAAPVAVEGILAGDHTVRVVKDGFLENSRVVSVPASGRSLRVALTPTRTPVRAMLQVEPEPPAEKGRGGGKKWLFIGLGAAVLTAGGVGIYLATKNDPPKISSVTANPSTALQGGAVSFSCVASDPEGKALSYSWSFGDGGSGTGANPTHVFTSSGTFDVSVDVTDDKDNKATDSTTVTVVSLSGVWIGRIANWPNYRATFSLNQNGATVTGTFDDRPINGAGTVAGSVTGPRSVALVHRVSGFRPGNWTGTLSADGRTIEGTVDWFTDGTQGFTLTR